jgi:hypothetical protein
MLGMSQLAVQDPELAWQALCGLNDAQEKILRLEIELKATAERIRDRVRAFTFSDSIVMFSLSDELPDAWAIVILASELFAKALHYCIPVRGAGAQPERRQVTRNTDSTVAAATSGFPDRMMRHVEQSRARFGSCAAWRRTTW